MERWTLPEGWEWVKVGEVAKDTTRRNPESEPDALFQYVDIAAVDNENFRIVADRVKVLSGKDAPSRARKVIRTKNVILATTRPYLKNIAIVPEELDNQICSTGFCVLCPDTEKVDYRYLYFAVKTDAFIKQLIPKQRGANYPAVTDEDVFDSEIPIPYPSDPARSLAEQRRIVARLEALLGEVRAMRDLIRAMRQQWDALMQSVLGEVFDYTSGDTWGSYPLGEIAPEDTRQISTSKYPDQVFNYWGLDAIEKEEFEEPPPNYVYGREIESTSILFDTSHVLYCKLRPYLNKVIVPSVPGVGSTEWIALRPNPKQLDRKYLGFVLRTTRFVKFATASSTGARMPRARKDVLRQFPVPIPYPSDPARSLAEQQRIVAYLEAVQAEVSAARQALEADERRVDELEQSILAAAFRGEV